MAVTYWPLCDSGVAFEGRPPDRVLSFGTSARLCHDNLVMYDRQTESLGPQLTGHVRRCADGDEAGFAIPMGVVRWADFRAEQPDALLLTRDTGFERPYRTTPKSGTRSPAIHALPNLPAVV